MRRGRSKFLAGILSTVLIFSSANYLVYAEEGHYAVTASEPATGDIVEADLTQEETTEGESLETESDGEKEKETVEEETSEQGLSTESDTATESAEESIEDPIEESIEESIEETAEIESSEFETESGTQVPSESETGTESGTQAETVERYHNGGEEIPAKGFLDVRIVAGAEVKKAQEFTVVLTGKTKEHKKTVTLSPGRTDEQSAPEVSAGFRKLEPGTYNLQVYGSGYATYKQTGIQLENKGYRLQLYVGRAPETGNADAPKPGLIVQDKSNDAVADAVVNTIRKKEFDKAYDFNGDGVVDLLDLDYFTKFIREENASGRKAVLESFTVVSPDDIVPSVGEKTEVVKGDWKSVLQGKGAIAFKTGTGDRISTDSPVEFVFDFSKERAVPMERILLGSPQTNAIEAGEVMIVYESGGKEQSTLVAFSASRIAAKNAQDSDDCSVSCSPDGTVEIHLDGQVAVKQVTFKVTKTSDEDLNLAEISSVEFVNGMEDRIPDPVVDIPTNVQAEAGNKSFTLSWEKQRNVTAYEIEITDGETTEFRKTTAYVGVEIKQFAKDKLVNKKDYAVRVRSLNGEWKSAFSDTVTVVPKADKVPDRPDNVSVTGGYRSIQVSWKAVKDADSYNVFYKEDGAGEYTRIAGIEKNSCQIDNLKDDTKYVVYVTAVNELGEGAASLTASDKTVGALTGVELPAYKLINTSNGEGVLSSHIKSATIGGGGSMVDSPLDKDENSALGLFDNNYYSHVYREDWDYGGAYPDNVKGVTVSLDDIYDIGMITFAEPVDLGAYSYVTVQYWDEGGAKQRAANVSILQKTSGSRKYYMIKFKEPVKTAKLQIGVGRYNGGLRKVTISEIRLYGYDSIEQDILNLYSDDLHISLKDDVTEKTIQELQNRLDTKDSVSGEYHPERELLQKELDTAKKLLETGGLGGVLQVNPNITPKKDSQISVGGLNAWQPLGVTAAAGEELIVYVGNTGMKDGASTNLQLVFTQYHSESGKFFATQNLKIGRNEITVPKISSVDAEKGGALYVQYNGNNDKDCYAVRVSGGVQFPVLNLYHVSDKQERGKRIAAYVQELKSYVDQLEAQHRKLHDGSQNEAVAYGYDARQCILNTTDIQTDKMMFSIPASQVLAGLGSNQEATLADTVQAMDDMLTLFYQHKGLTDSFAENTDSEVIAKNHLPYQYLNIRYMRMFSGAFMYASGNHIGIEWPETKGMMGGVPVVSTEKGEYVSGRYFGWGIAHEIGHEINQSAYVHAEVTNNYFAVLAQAKDANNTVRFQYPNVFQKVTSQTTGYSDNVFTQLGMYWQLHLAYDRDYNFRTYDTYQEIFEKRFFARVDSYARNTGLAPAPDGVALTLDGDRDQNLMRLASAAAQRDLSDFFIRWGMTPDRATLAYVKQFAPEERAIYYVDDEARVYEMENGSSSAVTGKNVVEAKADVKDSEVTLQMTFTADADVLQGYEITRVFIEQGKERKEVCGFTQSGIFTDYVAFAANRTVTYEVTAIDKLMNRSAVYRTNAVKIEGDGIQDKSAWTIETNMVSADDSTEDATEEKPCEPITVSASGRMIDNSRLTTFTGKADDADPYIVLKLNRNTQVSALRYMLSKEGQGITDYKVEVSEDGRTYTQVKTGAFRLENNSTIVYFENGTDPWVCTYDASYVRITAIGQKGIELSVTELDLYGPSGDNVEFLSAQNGQSGIGLLENDYVYDSGTSAKIPAGSIVFTGTYKGNPAYNVVVLYDEKGKIVGGEDKSGNLIAHQIILAPDPGNAMLGETSEGTWIYWIDPDAGVSQTSLPDKVRAELYRVDNALTNEGQRMVSDTKFVTLPETLPSIQINQ